jgi:hypothetical protein
MGDIIRNDINWCHFFLYKMEKTKQSDIYDKIVYI